MVSIAPQGQEQTGKLVVSCDYACHCSKYSLLEFAVVDIVLLAYFGWYQKYCPGCLYNELHPLLYGKKIEQVNPNP